MSNYLSNQKLKYISGHCGSGKTEWMYNEIISNPMKNFLVVQPTKQLLSEFSNRFNFHQDVHVVVSDAQNRFSKLPQVEMLLGAKQGRLLFITDKMFYKIPVDLLQGWTIFMDDCVDFCKLITKHKSKEDNIESVYSKMFNISKFYEIDADENSELNSMFYEYDLAAVQGISEDMQHAYTEYATLNDYHDKGVHKCTFDRDSGKVYIFGSYNLTRYENLDITYLANKFEDTLLYKFFRNSFTQVHIPMRQGSDMSRLTINYFDNCSNGLSIAKMQNQSLVNPIIEHIQSLDMEYFWTKNSSINLSLDGTFVTPNQRGVNSLQEYNNCVFLAAMNAPNDAIQYYNAIWGFSADDIKRQWELETLYQFVMRGSIRNPNSTETMQVYVYDKSCLELFVGCNTNLIDIDIGLASKATGRPVAIPEYYDKKLHATFTKFKKRNGDGLGWEVRKQKWISKKEDKNASADLLNQLADYSKM